VSATVTVHVVAQPVHYVSLASVAPLAPYSSWATAATNINEGVAATTLPGSLVLVSNGVYATGGQAVDGVMTSRVAVDKPLILRSMNGPEVTIIQGHQLLGTTNGTGAVRCVYLANRAVLSGFTLTNGAADNGGGVWCKSASELVINCTITGNSASSVGGGAYGGTLRNCIVIDNSAQSRGGAAHCSLYDSTLAGNNSTFSQPGWGEGGGGAFYSALHNCSLSNNLSLSDGGGAAWSALTECRLAANAAQGDGGGATDSTLRNCILQGNSARDGGGVGSGYGFGFRAPSLLNNCVLTGNSANYSGGGAAGRCTLNNCSLIGNSAEHQGGGGAYGTKLNNCTVTGNSAGSWGGGAYGGTLNNCTLTGNSADFGGGANGCYLTNCTLIGNSAGDGGGVRDCMLNNCIVYYNRAPVGENYSYGGLNYCCTTPHPGRTGNITNAPLFVNTNDWSNLRLRPDSPCIDTGNNDFVTTLTDLDGNPRIINGIVDMGAYEFVPLPPPTPAELVQHLIDVVNASDLRHKRPLLASLEAALASIERDNCHSAEGQLGAFQNKVAAQVSDMALATELIDGAGQVITALNCDGSPRVAGKIHSLKRHSNGKMQMKIKGEVGQTYVLEGSTNLVDWKPICVVRPDADGNCGYEDALAAKHESRFYRVVER
jgi:hypothetical protein